MRKILGWLGTLALAMFVLPATASAAPIWNAGNECPTDAELAAAPALTRQYYVEQATNCVYDTADNNITGTNAEAAAYLNSPPAPAVWGTGWVGLGQDDGAGEDIAGFSFTADAGNDDGTFLINTLVLNFGQFAVGIKDGGNPQWAIFLLPEGTFSGDWGLRTEGGDLSHFALYGRDPSGAGPGAGAGSPVPEPATLILLGTGLGVAATRARNRNKKRT